MKKGFMFITSSGYDPQRGKSIKDPYLGDTPTLGACRPDVRKRVQPGDQIFVVSGSVPGVEQYVVAGFEVVEKIHATEAYMRFPHLRLHLAPDGQPRGNIIVDGQGKQHELDMHSSFERRLEDYVVGGDLVALTAPAEISRGRLETVAVLRSVFRKSGRRPIDVIGRCSRLDEEQIRDIRQWLISIKRAA
jgi:hypothetical protein